MSYLLEICALFSRVFGLACDGVKSKLIGQIHEWEGPSGCASGGEKCLYKVSDFHM